MVLMRRWMLILAMAVVLGSMTVQVWQIWKFVHAGPRFTAQQGQELCERVKALEIVSYGYRDAGKTPLTCDYLERK